MNPSASPSRNLAHPFLRSNITAWAATAVDYTAMVALVEFVKTSPVVATAMAATLGALVNFLLNRHWGFASHSNPRSVGSQALRYGAVSVMSLAWNTVLMAWLPETLGLPYWQGRILGSLLVAWFWNYPLHRFFVFSPQ